jgi:hypothetical protein
VGLRRGAGDQRRDRDVAREARAAAREAVKKIGATGRDHAAARSTCTDAISAAPPAPCDGDAGASGCTPARVGLRPDARRGASLGLWAASAEDLPAWAAGRLDEIRALGATDVALVVGWRQVDVRATELSPGPDTPADSDVRAIAHAARERGLAVTIFPIVLLDKTGDGEWRGTLAPADVGAWWQAYEAFVTHYARLAADAGAAALVVGSELGSTETWRDRWYHLLSRVEDIFTGELWYSANWDHYEHVSFWKRLDAIGVTGYFELTSDRDASAAALAEAWAEPRDALLAFAKKHDKPLVLTEIGYPSIDGGAGAPWDYTADGAVDVEEQRRAYRALADAWGGTALAGVFAWEYSGDGGAKDRSYSPRGKPAECELAAWYSTD